LTVTTSGSASSAGCPTHHNGSGRPSPATISGGWQQGATLTFTFEGGEGPTLAGAVLEVDQPRLLAFTWNQETLRFELSPDGDGCRLVFVNTFTDGTKAARDGAGWHNCLDRLADLLAGHAPAFSRSEFDRVYQRYLGTFDPEFSTASVPPG
jgi:hypothetical protein